MKLKQKLQQILHGGRRAKLVELPEFGVDQDGQTFSVVVRELTVADRLFLATYLRDRPEGALVVVAALAAMDEEGELVFGPDQRGAVAMCESLPAGYMPALQRIAEAALENVGVKKI